MSDFKTEKAMLATLDDIIRYCEYSRVLYPLVTLRGSCIRLDLLDVVAQIDSEIVRYLKISLEGFRDAAKK